ncbi:unnamed protein product [Lymnaea stagnalis]|uniref:Peptidase S1 domain-containing protein n=1 Tax=Lymnaea stagnalis TaxID=6523 RepID=A0AAV2HA29_LYMST
MDARNDQMVKMVLINETDLNITAGCLANNPTTSTDDVTETSTEGYRILGGSQVDGYKYPYMASLQVLINRNWKHFCGAVLIAPNKLVTAAHCLLNNLIPTRIKIGALDLVIDGPKNNYSQVRTVSRSISHPRYKQPGERHDIGVIYLQTPVVFNENVKIAEIAPKGSSFEGETCAIAGWGISEESPQGSSYLREAFLKAISTERCSAFNWKTPITNKEICVFDEKNAPDYRARPCEADSGGELMCGLRYQYLAGVTSTGGFGCTGTRPGLYTRVSEYRDWINSV